MKTITPFNRGRVSGSIPCQSHELDQPLPVHILSHYNDFKVVRFTQGGQANVVHRMAKWLNGFLMVHDAREAVRTIYVCTVPALLKRVGTPGTIHCTRPQFVRSHLKESVLLVLLAVNTARAMCIATVIV